MPSFFEKLKKGMGVEGLEREPKRTEEKPEKKLPQDSGLKLRAGRTTQVSPKRTKVQKLKIETKIAEPKVEKVKKPEKGEESEVLEETEKPEEFQEPEKVLEKEEVEAEAKEEKQPERKDSAWQNLGGEVGQLAIDVYQTDNELVIQSTIAGVKPEDLDISIEADAVLIRGKRDYPPETSEKNYFYQECYWGPFSRQIILPEETDPNQAEASMKEGVLTIRIPKIERKKKRKITVKI